LSADITSLKKEYNKQVGLGHAAKAQELQVEINKQTQASKEIFDCRNCQHKIVKEQLDWFNKTEQIEFCDQYEQEVRFNHNSYSRFFLHDKFFFCSAAVVNYGEDMCEKHSSAQPKQEQLHELFTFADNYAKLRNNKFTTIRSVDFNKKCARYPNFPKGSMGYYRVKGKMTGIVKVLDWEDKAIHDIDLKILQEDIAPDACATHQDFVDKLNALYIKIYGHGSNKITTIKRVFYLEKIGVTA
jgi:hypothetical protein